MKSIIIAGNGPSLGEIDYSRLPESFDVYRCNQFYFEEKYFLGQKIKGVFYNPGVFFEQYYTLKYFLQGKEYECEEVFCSEIYWATENLAEDKRFSRIYPDVTKVYDVLLPFREIHAFIKNNDLFLQQRITSGVVMSLVAAIRGYKEIHLTGIDFYENGDYVFNIQKKNLLRIAPGFKVAPKLLLHTKNIDLQTLFEIQKHFDIKIYCLSPQSTLAEHFPLSPVTHNSFTPSLKSKNYTNDVMIPAVQNPLLLPLTKGVWRAIKRRIRRYIGKVSFLDRFFKYLIRRLGA